MLLLEEELGFFDQLYCFSVGDGGAVLGASVYFKVVLGIRYFEVRFLDQA